MEISAIQGIKKNIEQFDKYARDLTNIETADVPGDMVGMMISEKGVLANITALRAAHKMSMSMIDIFA